VRGEGGVATFFPVVAAFFRAGGGVGVGGEVGMGPVGVEGGGAGDLVEEELEDAGFGRVKTEDGGEGEGGRLVATDELVETLVLRAGG
jgi:hypothetical protein